MVFKNFRVNCILRVIGIATTILGSGCLFIFTGFYITAAIVFLFSILQTYLLIEYVEKTNMKLSRFISSIESDDFTIHFKDNRKGHTFKELTDALNRVLVQFGNSKREKEETLFYLETVMHHSPVALIAYDANQQVEFFNHAATVLTGLQKPTHIDELKNFNAKFSETLVQATGTGRYNIDNYALRITTFALLGKSIRLASIQNINREMQDNETDSWHKLLRVLTHEIMNSVTPITSIAEAGEKIATQNTADTKELARAFETIRRRSESLLHFTTAYRNFSNLPKAENENTDLAKLVEKTLELLSHRLNEVGIKTEFKTEENYFVSADASLSEQVFINILLNAIDALKNIESPAIEVTIERIRNKVQLTIKDNGCGIPQENMDKIFVPFFTTKPKGSGIGLSLSRELMKLQGGDLLLHSVEGEGTEVKMVYGGVGGG